MSEAMLMGHHLGKHLSHLHGGAFHRDFSEGLLRGGGFFDDVGNFFTKTIPSVASDVGSAVAGQFTDPNSTLRGTVLPAAAKYSAYAAPVLDAAGAFAGIPGAGEMVTAGLNAANTANQTAKQFGYGRRGRGKLMITHGGAGTGATNSSSGAYEGKGRERDDRAMTGLGRKRRAPAGPNDGRRKRAEIVRKVMGERGISMIEASKYVKAHGLY
jgi:hypothetical protein